MIFRRHADKVDAMLRSHDEGVAAMNQQRDSALKVIAKYSRLTNSTDIEEDFRDAVTYLERIPRVEPEALLSILDFPERRELHWKLLSTILLQNA